MDLELKQILEIFGDDELNMLEEQVAILVFVSWSYMLNELCHGELW